MKKENDLKATIYYKYFVLLFVTSCFIILSINSAFAFTNASDMLLNNSTNGVVESSHLIELDLNHENMIFVQESIVFSINGNKIPEYIMIIVPETAKITSFQRIEMMGTGSKNINYTRNGDVLQFNDPEKFVMSSAPVLYELSYSVSDDTSVSYRSFLKHFHNSVQDAYPISRLSVMVNYPEGTHVYLTDGMGNALNADSVKDESDLVTFAWNNPELGVLSVNTHKAAGENLANPSPNAFFFVLMAGAVFVLILVLYSRKKRGDDFGDLEDTYESLLAVILQLEDDRKNKTITENEFTKMHKKYKSQAMDTKKKMDILKKNKQKK
jgi:hypothetical protein